MLEQPAERALVRLLQSVDGDEALVEADEARRIFAGTVRLLLCNGVARSGKQLALELIRVSSRLFGASGERDVLLGEVGGCRFYIDHRQFETWKQTQLTLDVSAGEPEGFSLGAGPEGHFVIRSRVFDDDELRELDRLAR